MYMKTIAKPIEMISWTDHAGKIHPLRFKIQDKEGAYQVYKILKIYTTELERISGNKTYRFTCEIDLNGISRICEVRYDLETCCWKLFKL